MMLSKPIALESTAMRRFNEDVAKSAVTVGSLTKNADIIKKLGAETRFTADQLQQASQINALATHEMLSKMVTQGQLQISTLKSMFTGRHFTEVTTLYNLISGNMDNFTESIAEGANYLRDFDKQMFNVNNQLKQFKNQNLQGVNESLSGFSESLAGFLMIINESGSGTGKAVTSLLKLTTTLTAFLATVKLLSVISAKFVAGGGFGAVFGVATANPVIAGLTGLAFAIGLVAKQYRKLRIMAEDKIDLNINVENAIKQAGIAKQTLDAQIKTIEQFKQLNFENQGLDKINVSLISMYKNSADVLMNFDKLAQAQDKFGQQQYDQIIKRYEQKSQTLQNLQKQLKDLQIEEVQKARATSTYSYSKGIQRSQMEEFFELMRDPSKFKLRDATGKEVPSSISQSNLEEYFKSKYGRESISGTQISRLLVNMRQQDDPKKDAIVKEISSLVKEMKEIEKEKEPLKQVETARDTYKTGLKNFIEDSVQDIFKKYGTYIDLEGGKAMKDLSGQEAFTTIVSKDMAKILRENVVSRETEKGTLKGLSDKELDALVEKETEGFQKQFSKKIATLIKDGSVEGIEDLLVVLGGLMARTMGKEIDQTTQEAINKLGIVIGKKKELQQRDETKEVSLKYKSFQKESVAYAEALEKMGKSKAQQEIITYQYKLKQLEIDKKILSEQKKSFTERISTTFGKDSKISQGLLMGKEDVLKEQIKKAFDTKNKDAYNLLTDYAKVVYKIGILNQKIDIVPIERQEKAMGNIISTMKSYAKVLSETTSLQGGDILAPLEAKSKNIELELKRNKMKFSKTYAMDTSGIDWKDLASQEYDKLSKQKLDLSRKEALGVKVDSKLLNSIEKRRAKLEDILGIQELINEQEKIGLETQNKKLQIMATTGDLLSQLGSATGSSSISNIGKLFTQFQSSSKVLSENQVDFSSFKGMDFGEMFQSKEMGAMMKKAGAGMAVGSIVGQMFGGGQSSQSGGSIGGAIGGAVGGPIGMAIGSVAGAALGKALAGDDKTEEAQKYNKEQAKLYQKNTEALQKLAQNMANLSSGVSNLNSSLTNSFAKIPTIKNLDNATVALEQLQDTMIKNRDFADVAYQVTHKKSGHSGFLGIGSTPDTYWTETVKMSVDSMLKKYGFYGDIKDMSTEQMRDFADYLDELDIGDSDNFSMLASAVKDYAEALDKLDTNIDKIFYDATIEGFKGISSLQEQQLRKQIEDFYKNLGIQIDDGLSRDIDELVKKMSTAVTITQDVRQNFISSWKELGTNAGKTFQTSLQPYMEAILDNMSQVYYDVYFSEIDKKMEEDFKSLSEKLVELKKQGESLNWDDLTDEVSKSFEDLLTTMNMNSDLKDSYNDILESLQEVALEQGKNIGDMLNLGILTSTQKQLVESFEKAVRSDKVDGGMSEIGGFLGDLVGDALSKKVTESLYSDTILNFSKDLDEVLSGEIQFSNVAGLLNQATSIGIGLEQERLRMEAITSLFDFDKDINYTTQDSKVTYSSGVSQSVVNNYNLSATVNAGNVIESENIESLVESTLDPMIEKLKIDRGIDITKNY